MGKYAALKSVLDRFEQPLEFQQRVDQLKQSFAGQTVVEMARAFAHARGAKQKLEAEIKLHNVELEALSQLLVSSLEDQQLQKIQLETGETLYLHSEPFCSVVDKSVVIDWVKNNDMQSLLTLHYQTLNALMKERLINGQEAIPGVSMFLKTSARLRNGNVNEE